MIKWILLSLVLLAAPAGAALATDAGKEARWAEQVEVNLFDGEIVWLESDGHRFLGILITPENSRGAVVIAHGLGVHPDWNQVTNPLRVALAEDGWTTLSIQMPVLANGVPLEEYQPLFPEAPGRFDAAAAMLQGSEPLYLVAHSLGASMASWYLSRKEGSPYSGFVGIGMGGSRAFDEANNVLSLEKIALPVLDLYGEADNESVLESADARRAAQSGNAGYRQQVVPGANHFFDGHNPELVEAVRGWLESESSR